MSGQVKKKRSVIEELENTRYIKFWHDHSTVSGRSLYLHCTSFVYDVALYLTDSEYMEETGLSCHVQHHVEFPYMYIIGNCSSAEEDQLLYSSTRVDCLQNLQENPTITTSTGRTVKDIVRFFHGDFPAQEHEIGNKRGGNYPCVCCSTHSSMYWNIRVTFQAELQTIEDRVNRLLKSVPHNEAKKKLVIAELPRKDVVRHMKRRKMPTNKEEELKVLRGKLEEKLAGVNRLPALLSSQDHGGVGLEEIGLDKYEVLPCEALHVSKEHIKNVIAEIKEIHETDGKLNHIISQLEMSVFGKRNHYKGSDFRKLLQELAKVVGKCQDARKGVKELIESLDEIVHMMYAPALERTSASVLKMFNMTYKHALLMNHVFGDTKRRRKLFGEYFHSLLFSGPIQYKVVPMSSVYAEKQEQMFSKAKQLVRTTNQHTDHSLKNFVTRVEAEEQLCLENRL